jgi:hypothetical protein
MGDGRYPRDEIAVMSQRYADRIAALNPAFTPALGLRDAAGRLRAIASCFCLGREIAAPIVGYDGAMPVAQGLYRRAS